MVFPHKPNLKDLARIRIVTSKNRTGKKIHNVTNFETESYYHEALEQARNGNVEDALELLEGFCDFYIHKQPLPEAVARYLFDAFNEYLNQYPSGTADIGKSLLLRRKRGRKPQITTVDPVRVVAAMYLKMKRDGLKKEAAKDAVVEEYPISKRRLEGFDKDLNLIRELDIQVLETLAKTNHQNPQ